MNGDDLMFAQWNRAVAALVTATATPAFPERLESAIRSLVDFDISMVFAYRGRSRPAIVCNNMAQQVAAVVADDYVQGPYILDPFYSEVQRGRVSGIACLAELAPDQFYESEYYKRHYSRTRIVDEIGFFMGLRDGVTAVHSVARIEGKPRFSKEEYARLADAAAVPNALGTAHWNTAEHAIVFNDASNGASRFQETDPVETALKAVGLGTLTDRQSEIIALLLKGHSSESIALQLDISVGTVKNHRKNIYAKLGISSQTELFSIFLECLRAIVPKDA